MNCHLLSGVTLLTFPWPQQPFVLVRVDCRLSAHAALLSSPSELVRRLYVFGTLA